jgi:hypothetical protein
MASYGLFYFRKRPYEPAVWVFTLSRYRAGGLFRQAARRLLHGQTVRIPRFNNFSGGHWTAGFKALPETDKNGSSVGNLDRKSSL